MPSRLDDSPSLVRVAHALACVPALFLLVDALFRWTLGPSLLAEGALTVALYAAALRLYPIGRENLSRPIIALSALFLAAIYIVSASLYDTSWDGTSYHLPAVLALAQGWNPVASAAPVEPQNFNPNGIWTAEALLFRLIGSIEGAKAMNGVLLLAAFLALLAAVRAMLARPLRRLELATVAATAGNPVALAQLFTFYVDGALYEAGLLCLAALMLAGSPQRRAALGLLAASIVLMTGAKLTAAFFALALPAVALAALWRRTPGKPAVAAIAVATFAVATLAVGFRPYVTNVRDHGQLVVERWGDDVDRPRALAALSPPMLLLWGVFGRTAGLDDATSLKSPVSVAPHEVLAMATPDPRIGGFGPLFAAETVLAAAVLVLAFVLARGRAPPGAALFVLALLIVATCAIFPEPWWARLVPFLWTAPLFAALGGAAGSSRAVRLLAAGVVMLAVLNGAMAFGGNLARDVLGDLRTRALMQTLKSTNQEIVLVPAMARGFELTDGYRLRQWGVPFRVAAPNLSPALSPDCGRLLKLERLAYCLPH